MDYKAFIKCLSALLMLLPLAACGTFQPSGPDSHYVLPEVGSSVTINQELEVPPGHSRVFIQHGRVLRWSAIDRYYPHCNFEIRVVTWKGFIISPGLFTVNDVNRLIEHVVSRDAVLLASSSLHGLSQGGGYSNINLGIRMSLMSEHQPLVMRLTCYGAESEPSSAYQPSIVEIVEVLGELATFKAKLPD